MQAEVLENCTMVSVISARFRGVPGVIALMLETLGEAGVAVYQTADSQYSVSVLVPEADTQKAVRALHAVFRLERSSEPGPEAGEAVAGSSNGTNGIAAAAATVAAAIAT